MKPVPTAVGFKFRVVNVVDVTSDLSQQCDKRDASAAVNEGAEAM